MAELSRLSLNQITTNSLTLPAAIELCREFEIPAIGLWREKIHEIGLRETARMIRESGLTISSLCRGGFFPAPTREERARRIEDNRRAIDEAFAVGAGNLVLVCGGLNGCTIDAARQMIFDGIAAVADYASAAKIKLGVEPLHPMFAADRSIVCSLAEANDLAEQFDSETVGVIVDVFHVWFDRAVYKEIRRAGRRILGFHVSDWRVPLPNVLLSRAMMGDGVIELRRLREAAEAAGYDGLIEVEIFNRAIWDAPANETVELIKTRFQEFV